jgi:DNA polymerase III epsilon subunit-like protein
MTRQDPADRTAQFDMFIDAAVVQETADYSTSRARRVKRQPLEEADMVAHLAASGRYRILHKLEPRRVAVSVRPEYPLKGVILDTETTGLNHRRDEIIEIGVIAFTFDEQGAIGDVTGVYGGLQQPEAIPVTCSGFRNSLAKVTFHCSYSLCMDTIRTRLLPGPASAGRALYVLLKSGRCCPAGRSRGGT